MVLSRLKKNHPKKQKKGENFITVSFPAAIMENEHEENTTTPESSPEKAPAPQDGEYEEVVESYFKEDSSVKTLIHINVDTKFADTIAQKIAEFKETSDVLLVTGDIDIVVNAHFDNYAELKNFILKEISNIKGIKETKTFLVVSSYKSAGHRKT